MHCLEGVINKYQGMGTEPLHLQLSEIETETGAGDVEMMRTGIGVTGAVRAKVGVGAGMG